MTVDRSVVVRDTASWCGPGAAIGESGARQMRHSGVKRAAILVGVVLAGAVGATPAGAAQSTQQLQCGGTTLTIRVNNNNSSDNGGWSVGQIVNGGSGHLIPTSFSFSAFDLTVNTPLFGATSSKGHGNANQNQQAVTCSQTQIETLADLLQPGDQLPPGTALTDQVRFTITVTAVPKP